jgi:hypothetical protein
MLPYYNMTASSSALGNGICICLWYCSTQHAVVGSTCPVLDYFCATVVCPHPTQWSALLLQEVSRDGTSEQELTSPRSPAGATDGTATCSGTAAAEGPAEVIYGSKPDDDGSKRKGKKKGGGGGRCVTCPLGSKSAFDGSGQCVWELI